MIDNLCNRCHEILDRAPSGKNDHYCQECFDEGVSFDEVYKRNRKAFNVKWNAILLKEVDVYYKP